MAERLHIKIGVNELEVEGDQEFIEKHLEKFMERCSSESKVPAAAQPKHSVSEKSLAKDLTPAEYLRQKRPSGGTRILIVLGKYLLDHRGQAEFSKADIRSLAVEARIKDVHPQYYVRAIEQGLLRTLNDDKFAVTMTGEDAVEGMVDES